MAETSYEVLRRNPSGNWVILIFSGQKPCTLYTICFKLFWYKIFVHWKSKLLNVLVDCVLKVLSVKLSGVSIFWEWENGKKYRPRVSRSLIEGVSKDEGNGSENVTQKMKQRCFKLHRCCCNSFHLSNVCDFLRELNYKGPHLSSQKEKEHRCHVFQ